MDFITGQDVEKGRDLVDRLWFLQQEQKNLKEKEIQIKEHIANLAQQHETEKIFGTKATVSVKPFTKVSFPEENKPLLKQLLKERGLSEKYHLTNYLKLSADIRRNQLDKELANLANKEQQVRITIREKGLLY